MSIGTRLVSRFATPNDAAAVERFNQRLRAGNSPVTLSVTPEALAGSPQDGLPRRTLMIAEDGAEIRAGVILYHHTMYLHGNPRRFCWVQMPISEGLVNRAHALSIVQLIRAAVKYEPLLISLGVGSLEETWAKFAKSSGWKHKSIPFFFYPVRCGRVIRGLRYLRKRPKLEKSARMLSNLGLGVAADIGLKLRRLLSWPDLKVNLEPTFGSWADEVFQKALADYPFAARRDSVALNRVYPADDPRFRRLRVRERHGTDAGWVVVSAAQMKDNQYFGDLKVGVLVDGFGPARSVPALMAAAARYLIGERADLLVANWSHGAWTAAARQLGFLSGPSNYFAFVPKEGAAELDSLENLADLHITRGDSDGMSSFRKAAY